MEPYQNPDLPAAERVQDLLSRLSLEEKISLTKHASPAIDRLGVPAYNWWNEAIHGVGRAGTATVFPQCIGMAASFDLPLFTRVARAISDEARAKHHDALKRGKRSTYRGLTLWSPNVNIFRDPRWGRGQETYGEDPYLTSRLGAAFVRELQGDDPVYLKTVATPKHFAVHSGPENGRHGFNAEVSEKDLRETYLPAFRAAVVEAGAFSVMSAYNRLNGVPCSANSRLLRDILRGEWGFRGCVVSDCGAVDDIHGHHGYTPGPQASAAEALRAGCDLSCGESFSFLGDSVEAGLVTVKEIDEAVARILELRFRLGLFDPPSRVRWASIPHSVVECEAHRELCRGIAAASIVLLENRDRVLPLSKSPGVIAVTGPNADSVDALLGNYNGTPSRPVTVLDGIVAAVSPETRVLHEPGCPLHETDPEHAPDSLIEAAVAAAARAEVVVAVLGLSPRIEGEEGDAYNSDASGDRLTLRLPGRQQELFDALAATGKPVVVVLMGGTAFAIPEVAAKAAAVLAAWYPGAEGGAAVADVLFGRVNPSGRLPLTFPNRVEDLPPFESYSMEGRTYRYSRRPPLYPFGFGRSYTEFRYADLELSPDRLAAGRGIGVRVRVTNTGARAGNEVVQLYLRDDRTSCRAPVHSLCGVRKVYLEPGEERIVEFSIDEAACRLVLMDGSEVLEPGSFTVFAGGSQPDDRSRELTGVEPLQASFIVEA